MKALPLITGLVAAITSMLSAPALAQTQTPTTEEPAAAQTQAPKTAARTVYHAGGPRHDEWAHEATLRARERGQKTQQPAVHPGGRHDQVPHEAALRAQRQSDEATRQ